MFVMEINEEFIINFVLLIKELRRQKAEGKRQKTEGRKQNIYGK
jgi:hypothetical protein